MLKVLTPFALFSTFSQAIQNAFDPSSQLFYWIWGAMAAVLLAMLISAVYRAVVGFPIRRMLAKKLTAPEHALTLEELGCDRFLFRFFLRPNALLRKLVFAVEREEFVETCAKQDAETQESTDQKQSKRARLNKVTKNTAFYLNEAQLYRMERTFSFSWQIFLAIPICAAVMFALGLLLFWLLPAAL